jgi:hypothetical protein
MRYFEIVKPPARQISTDADPREGSAGESRSDGMKSAESLKTCTSFLLEPQNLISRQSRRRHLSPLRSR